MNYQEEFNQGYAGNAMPNDPDALAAWNAGVRTREENERVTQANSAVVAAWRLAGGVPKPGLVARAFIAGVTGLLMFVACLLALASALGQR